MKSHKILGLVLIAVAVVMVILGFARPEVVDAFNIYWIASVLAFLPGVLLVFDKVEAATSLSRIVVGAVFIVSGIIKANDTVGFAFKLEEYFDENALGSFWANFHDFALPISIFVSGIEVLLGLAVIFGARIRLVAVTLLAMTLFFGWLTWFTAGCNDAQMAAMAAGTDFDRTCVTDCGCFGDALRGSVGRSLTPWESFYKDLGLFFMVLVILFRSGSVKVNTPRQDMIILPAALIIILLFGGWLFGWMFPTWFFLGAVLIYFVLKRWELSSIKFEWILAATFAFITYAFAFYTYRHLPIKDYRPYAEGKDINDQMKDASELGLEPTIYATIYKLKNSETGEERTMNSKEYLDEGIWKDKNWKITYSSPEPIVIQWGYEPPIATFTMMNDEGSDIGDELINDENYSFMVVMYDIGKTREGKVIEKVRKLHQQAETAGYDFYAVTASEYDVYETFRHDHQLTFPFYTADGIFLKTIIRANPGVLLLKNGTVVKKWHGLQLPAFEQIEKEYLK